MVRSPGSPDPGVVGVNMPAAFKQLAVAAGGDEPAMRRCRWIAM
jgi:hypothetical protein